MTPWISRFRNKLGLATHAMAERWLARHGYEVSRSSNGYHDAQELAENARRAGCSICEYLEAQETDERKIGRRDRIIAQLQDHGCFREVRHVIEIGTGTGMYLDPIVNRVRPDRYEIYETAVDWKEFLRQHVKGFSGQHIVHDADGHSLYQSQDASAELVHAHGVFVYLRTIATAKYLAEMARVCRPGGHVVFDCYLDTSFDAATMGRWIDSGWRFPVVWPKQMLEDLYGVLGLRVVHRFHEIHGASHVDYEVLQKV